MAIIELRITAPTIEVASIGRLTKNSDAVTMQASTTIWNLPARMPLLSCR